MQAHCAEFFRYARLRYPRYFDGPNVIAEFGSYDVNGSIREFFTGWREYVGIDWRPGPGVDVVSLAKDVPFDPERFDVVASTFMLEHDPEWRSSLGKMVQCLKRTGVLILSWGGAYYRTHNLDTSPDGRYHRLSGIKVLNALCNLGMSVHEVLYDNDLVRPRRGVRTTSPGRFFTCINLIGFKDPALAGTPRRICPFLPRDA